MGRHYVRVKLELVDHEKFLDLTPAQRGGWLELLLRSTPGEGRLASRAHAEKLLRRAGHEDPEGDVAALMRVRMLDEHEDGRVRMHDWDDH